MKLKYAVFISFVGHCALLAPLANFGVPFPDIKKVNAVEVTYCPAKPQAITQPQVQAPQDRRVQIENKKIGQAAAKRHSQNRPRKQAASRAVKPEKAAVPASIPGTTLPNTPECVSYYQYIREEIRQGLEREYRSEYGEGDVAVNFDLLRNGRLINLEVIEAFSVNIPVLHRIARDSIKLASPFRAFPAGLEQSQISFSLTITFKKK
ncbi:MAG: hypothetical protein NTV07_03355 [Candidatus Omnitrophica bacterium]|nr:hypothetical protein [Candidatus Omnitrophota bacterium]